MGKKINLRKILKKRVDINFKSAKLWTIVMVFAGFGIFGYGGYIWANKVIQDPEQMFYSMISRNLETESVARVITQEDAGSFERQVYQVRFTPVPLVHTVSSVEQITQTREKSSVANEMIGFKDKDYVRYTNISIPPSQTNGQDFSKLVGVWALRDPKVKAGQDPQFLNEAIFTFVPFGNFQQADREKLIEMIRKENVYEFGTDQLKYDGVRPIYELDLRINPRRLVTVMKEYSNMTGLGDSEQLKPDQYADVHNFPIKIEIDVLTRHLLKISYSGSTRTETYTGYGLRDNPELPKETITVDELNARVSGGQAE